VHAELPVLSSRLGFPDVRNETREHGRDVVRPLLEISGFRSVARIQRSHQTQMHSELARRGAGNHEALCEVGLGVTSGTLNDVRWHGRRGAAQLRRDTGESA
jgi:hypothetical protein